MADESVMASKLRLRARVADLRASLAPREDPYAGADITSARRLVPMQGLLATLLGVGLLPRAAATQAIGAAGWVVAAAVLVGQLLAVRRLADPDRPPSFNALLAFAYAGVAGVALLEWLAGGHSPFMLLNLLWLGAGVGVHPPRR